MALVFVPFYVRILGVEAYGLIGIYASLRLALALLDAGLRPTLAREMARYTGGGMDVREIRTLLRSVELPLFALAALMAVAMAAAAPWLSIHGVHPNTLAPAAVAQAFAVMGLVAAAQFVEAAYDSCLAGLQRQVLQNAIATFVATLRGAGALAVISIVPDIGAYFLWQAVVALVSLLLLGVAVHRSLPRYEGRIRFSVDALAKVRAYAGGMLGISVVALLLTQSDKFLLARFMPLSDVGYYTLAASLVGSLAMLATPIGGAFYPRFTELVQRGDEAGLAQAFHQATKLMTVVAGAASAMFFMFGVRLITVWVRGVGIGEREGVIMALLALSGLFNGLTTLPYLLLLAHGVTKLTLRMATVLLIIFVPALILMVSHFGGVGAAACVAGMNLANLVCGATMTFRRYLRGEVRIWWLNDILKPCAVVYAVALALRQLAPPDLPLSGEVPLLAACGIVILGFGALADADFRRIGVNLVQQLARRSQRAVR